jgi:flagella basal body P-ring formation protein FlgA
MTRAMFPALALVGLLLIAAPAAATKSPDPVCAEGVGLEGELLQQLAEQLGSCPMLRLGPADSRALIESRPGQRLANLRLDMRVGSFAVAVIELNPSGQARVVRQVRGSVSMPRQVPVVTRRIVPGETIEPGDIKLVAVDSRQVPANAVLDVDELVGVEPRWPISPLVPVTRAQVKVPRAVERGAPVSAHYRRSGIELTTQLVAMEAGTVGQLIALRNPASNKIVRGRIAEPGAVVLE